MRVESVRLFARWMETRLPFKYGIATLTALPHLMVQVTIADDRGAAIGQASDGLAPKWFTKNPESLPAEDILEMVDVIQQAARLAEGRSFASPFELWRELYADQNSWAQGKGYPALLWHFGVSLAERAVIQAWCRRREESFAEAVISNSLGIDLGAVHSELAGIAPASLLPSRPSVRIHVRHTVGLGDPLRGRGNEDPDDGLPVTLSEAMRAYGLRYLKIKTRGDLEWDRDRLAEIARIVEEEEEAGTTRQVRFTLDGNEQFADTEEFRDHWDSLAADPTVGKFFERLLFVEQPVKRAEALSGGRMDWLGAPPVIIDESDGGVEDLERALDRGYRGTSHKNCKGVFKGIAHACLIAKRNDDAPAGRSAGYILSGEDLANVGPLALLQDLDSLSMMPVDHVERNGHHYFRGLSMWSPEVQDAVVRSHPELYASHAGGFAALRVEDGALSLAGLGRTAYGPDLIVPDSQFSEITSREPTDLSSLQRRPR